MYINYWPGIITNFFISCMKFGSQCLGYVSRLLFFPLWGWHCLPICSKLWVISRVVHDQKQCKWAQHLRVNASTAKPSKPSHPVQGLYRRGSWGLRGESEDTLDAGGLDPRPSCVPFVPDSSFGGHRLCSALPWQMRSGSLVTQPLEQPYWASWGFRKVSPCFPSFRFSSRMYLHWSA